jgi:predicted outer membrane repeat protein
VNITFRENRALFYGGGMYNFAGSSPSLTNVTFTGNIAEDEFGGGGGMFNDASNPSLNHVLFRDNWSRYGGGMRNIRGSSPALVNVTFDHNLSHVGGGMNNNASSPSLAKVTFLNNSGFDAGGMNNESGSSPTLTDVTFSGNAASEWGGGMVNYGGSIVSLTNVTFSGNSTNESGGAMYNSTSSVTLLNVTFSGNSVTPGGAGAGMYNYSSSLALTNVTFNGNTADPGSAGAIYNWLQSNLVVINSILYGDAGGEIVNDGGSVVVSYSIVQGGHAGTGNLDADPLLQPLGRYGGFTRTMPLGFGSPAIDRGTDSGCPAADQRGLVRPRDGDGDGAAACDIGATESRLVAKSFASAGTQDGWVLESTETSSIGGTMNAAGAALRVGDDAQDRQYRSLVSFDTAALPDHAVIASARLKLKAAGLVGTNPFTTHMGLKVDIRQPYFGPGAALATGDFQAPAGAAAVGTFNATPSTDAWYSAVLGSAAYPQVNPAGTTQFRLRFLKDDDDNLQADYIKFYSGDYALDPSFRPQLIVRYYLP